MSVAPPIEPMLAKLAGEIPTGDGFLYEPKWDGFRAIIFRNGSDLYIQSRDLRPFDRYFPDLHDALLARLPPRCVVDGEIVIATPGGLDFDALQIDGELKNPAEFYFERRADEKFDSLVERRKNFHREMLRDVVMGK